MVIEGPGIDLGTPSKSVKPRIREIADPDIHAVIDLLVRGFPRPREFWDAGFERLRGRPVPAGMPRYGYLLEAEGRPVGVLLLISSVRRRGCRDELFSNLSSWYVEPGFRGYAATLYRHALSNRQATYLNISAASSVRPVVEAFGFRRYSQGQVLAPLGIARNHNRMPARIVGVESINGADVNSEELQLLTSQARYGCIAFGCNAGETIYPFVFVPRLIKGFIPCAHLAYCRDLSSLVNVAGTIGRHLLRLGRPLVLIDANGPVGGIRGRYFPGVAPKYYRGDSVPALGDLTETEATIFGI